MRMELQRNYCSQIERQQNEIRRNIDAKTYAKKKPVTRDKENEIYKNERETKFTTTTRKTRHTHDEPRCFRVCFNARLHVYNFWPNKSNIVKIRSQKL